MIPALLALAAAVGWGVSDFVGGDATRRGTSVFVVVAIAELMGVVVLGPVLLVRGVPPPRSPELLLAAVAGVAVTIELGLIYRALGRGQAFITAPTGALGTAAAVAIGLVDGDPLTRGIAIGLVCALLGGAISARSSSAGRGGDRVGSWRTIGVCVGAAAAIGTMLATLHAAGGEDAYWATVVEHASTAISAALAARVSTRRPLRTSLPHRTQLTRLGLIATAGVGGDLAYASASHDGALSIVAAISSLYPVATIVLARLLQHHRATRTHAVGIALALAGAVILGQASVQA